MEVLESYPEFKEWMRSQGYAVDIITLVEAKQKPMSRLGDEQPVYLVIRYWPLTTRGDLDKESVLEVHGEAMINLWYYMWDRREWERRWKTEEISAGWERARGIELGAELGGWDLDG